MSYEPLHHKYRPQSFSDLVGQDAIATTLTNAIKQERIAPAYLFTGPRGTGKTSSARILAKSLNCLSSKVPTEKPCGDCQVCSSITKGSALDVIEIDAASNTGVDNIRELIDRAQFAPVQCRYKVYIIDEVHMLSTAAFNALLKTLEEPPKKVVFVLATTDPQRVLPTIISRCQRFDFRRIPLEAMVKHLRHIANQENINITDDALTLVAQIAQGGLRDAESTLDQLSLLSGGVTVERVWDLVGAVPERDLLELLQAIASDNHIQVIDITRHMMDRGREPLIVLQNLASFYRDLLIAKTSPNRPDLSAVTAPIWKALCEFQGLDISQILTGQKHLKDSEFQIKNTTQPRLWLEVTLLGLLPSAISAQSTSKTLPNFAIKQNKNTTSSPKEVKTQVTENKEPISTPPPVLPENSEPSKDSINPISEQVSDAPTEEVEAISELSETANFAAEELSLDRIWQLVLDNLPIPSKALFRQHGNLVYFQGEEARVSIKSMNLFKMATERVPHLEEAFLKVLTYRVRVNILVAGRNEPKTTFANQRQTPPNSPDITESAANNIQAKVYPQSTNSAPSSPEIKPQTSQPSEITEQPKPIDREISDNFKQTREQNAEEEAIRADADIVNKGVQILIEKFKGKIAPLSEDLDLSETSASTNLRSPQLNLEFDFNSELEDEDNEAF